jgi:hypothetical protein
MSAREVREAAAAGGLIAQPRLRILSLLERESFLIGILVLWAVALVAAAPQTLVQDSWMTLLSGREIVEYGIPRTETLTAIGHGRQWIDQQWLAQLAFYGAWKAGGIKLVMLVHALVVEAALVCGVAAARARGASRRAVASGSMLTLLLAPWALQLRAQTFALLCFAVIYWLLSSDSRKPSPRVLLCLPVLVLWANMHGSVVLGAGLVGLAALTRIVKPARRLTRSESLQTIVLLVGAPVAIFVSPYGLGLVHYYRFMLGNPSFARYISEWQPTRFSPLTIAFFTLAFVLVGLAARYRGRLTRFEELALLALLVTSLMATRNIVWFSFAALASAPILFSEVAQPDAAPTRRDARVNMLLSGVAAVVALVLAVAGPFPHNAGSGPTAIGNTIAQLAHRDPSLKIFPDDEHGDWLLWEHPELAGRVAYDIRFELLTPDELKQLALLRADIRTNEPIAKGYRLFMLDRSTEKDSIRWLLSRPGSRLVARAKHFDVIQTA